MTDDNIITRLGLFPNCLFAIDPGNKKSGWLICEPDESVVGHLEIASFGIDNNREIRKAIAHHRSIHSEVTLLIETPKPTGIPVAAEVMETLIEIGRFLQMWRGPWSYIFRHEAKVAITRSSKATDANVSQALKDRFGGDSIAVGGKKCKTCKGNKWTGREHTPCEACDETGYQGGHGPGPLFDVKEHIWAALLLVCWWDESQQQFVHDVAGKQPTKKKKSKKGTSNAKRSRKPSRRR